MATVRPFKAVRPAPALADKVAALPYDVMNAEEAKAMVAGNPHSFLHVDKAEIDLPPEIDHYDRRVYEKARDTLYKMISDGVLIREDKPCFYIYRQIMNGRAQTGVVGCASIDDYLNNIIKKHEHTRADKERDRINHVDFCDANTGPIFLTYKSRPALGALMNEVTNETPVYDFTTDEGVRNTVWVVDCPQRIETIGREFAQTEYLYIADGHHRCASGVRVGGMRREQNPGYTGAEEFNYFLCVLFPDEQLFIMDYNRVVRDLFGRTEAQFMDEVRRAFDVVPYTGGGAFRPEEKHTFGMYLDDVWYVLTAKPGTFDDSDPVARLDVSILQENLLRPILGIEDPRTDERIDFVGGIRGLGELERRVREGMKVAFAMCPTSIDELIAIADAGQIMPPKSTWFEPKLLSGLFIHELR